MEALSANQPQPHESPHTFISLLTYPYEPLSDSHPYLAFNACNKKEDILTQSQMLKSEDAMKFIASQ